MNQTDCLQALQVAVAANVPVLVWGEPGAGKTASINAMVKAMGWHLETVLASLREPSDFAGLPVLSGEDVRMAPPDWARRLAGREDAVCFFDEISTAAPSTQRALLRVIHERVVGDLTLGPEVRMVAAANPAEMAAGGWDLTPPLANRFLHLDWKVDPAVVAAGMTGRWPNPQPLTIDPQWAGNIGYYGAVVSGFLSARPEQAHQLPKNPSEAGRGWPSPRSWESVVRVLAACDNSGISNEARLGLVAGLVGDGSAIEFARYERDLDLPNPEQLLADPSSYQRPERDDQVHAVIAAVTSAVHRELTAERWTQAMEVFSVAAETGTVDIAALGVRSLAGCRPRDAMVPDRLLVFGDILMAAGVLNTEAPRKTKTRVPR
jgi:hypothetical protein